MRRKAFSLGRCALAVCCCLPVAASGHDHAREPLFRAGPGSAHGVGRQPAGIALGDVNGDGKPDVVTANSGDNNVSVLLGDGRGGFHEAEGSPFAAGPKPHLIALGDLNNDGKPDLGVTEHDSNGVRVFLGDGSGRFTAAPGSPFPALETPNPHNHGLVFADVNGDGNLDITTANQNDKSVSVLLGDGKGGFHSAAGSPFKVSGSPYPQAVGDVNGDAKPDIVTPNIQEGTVGILLGDGKGGFRAAPGSPHRVENRPYYAALGDVNGDGKPDIVTTHDDITLVCVLLGDGRGGFRRGPTSDAGYRGWKIDLRDVNRDGKLDFITGALGNRLLVLLGDNGGRFVPGPGSPYAVGRGPWSIAVGDLNQDGKLDIVTSNAEENSVTVLLGR